MHEDLTPLISKLLTQGNQARISSDQIKERFDGEDPSAYGVYMPRWFPDYDYVHELLGEILKPFVPGKARVLDLGGGTGRVAKLLLDAFPLCDMVVQDISANMLSEVTNKLREHAGRFECIEADFFAESFDFKPNSFDAVISVHAIHHGRHLDAYRDLYHKIHTWLKPAGAFVCLDNVAGDTLELATLNYATWANSLRAQFDDAQVRGIVEMTLREDSPLSLREHLRLLDECGFVQADVVWKKHIFGLYVGVKGRGGNPEGGANPDFS